jgi:hypothetical protein
LIRPFRHSLRLPLHRFLFLLLHPFPDLPPVSILVLATSEELITNRAEEIDVKKHKPSRVQPTGFGWMSSHSSGKVFY